VKYKEVRNEQKKRIAVVAHDNKKVDLLEWAKFNRDLLAQHELYATGTMGHLLERPITLMPPSRTQANTTK
jgi:methylglyoxal synthase